MRTLSQQLKAYVPFIKLVFKWRERLFSNLSVFWFWNVKPSFCGRETAGLSRLCVARSMLLECNWCQGYPANQRSCNPYRCPIPIDIFLLKSFGWHSPPAFGAVCQSNGHRLEKVFSCKRKRVDLKFSAPPCFPISPWTGLFRARATTQNLESYLFKQLAGRNDPPVESATPSAATATDSTSIHSERTRPKGRNNKQWIWFQATFLPRKSFQYKTCNKKCDMPRCIVNASASKNQFFQDIAIFPANRLAQR